MRVMRRKLIVEPVLSNMRLLAMTRSEGFRVRMTGNELRFR